MTGFLQQEKWIQFTNSEISVSVDDFKAGRLAGNENPRDKVIHVVNVAISNMELACWLKTRTQKIKNTVIKYSKILIKLTIKNHPKNEIRTFDFINKIESINK